MSAEWTQELQAADVLEVIDAPGPRPQPVARRTSSSSIAPVGLDLSPTGDHEEAMNPTMQIRLPARRRQLARVVAAAVAACAVILVAAGVARVVHAGGEPAKAASASMATSNAAAAVTTAAAKTSAAAPVAASTDAKPAPATSPASDAPTTGTVRLTRPARPGAVWLDGRKLTSDSALVSCGAHRIKIGRGRTHAIDVPCGSEIAVSR